MIDPGKGTGGGILRHPDPKASSIWIAYVEVDDVAASTRKARSLGAQVEITVRLKAQPSRGSAPPPAPRGV